MHVTRISTTAGLERLQPDWNGLAAGIPFRSWQWLFPWWQHYAAGKSLYTLAVHDEGGELVAIAPWFIEVRGNDRVIQFLGSGQVCSDYLTLLAAPEQADRSIEAIAQWLASASHPGNSADAWDLLDFDGIPVGDEPLERLVAALAVHGCTSTRRPALNCWRMALPSTWDAFMQGLKASHARKIRKVRRRLFDNDRGVVRVVQTAADLERGMEILVDLHQLRWNALGEPGCFSCDMFSGFLHDAARELLAAEMLQLAWLEVEGKPAAAEFLVTSPHTQYIYQGGLDPAARQHSPGHALISALFQDAIANGCGAIDFLRGDEPYKATWGAEPVATERIRVASRRLGPQLRNHAWFAGQVMKSWVKQGLVSAGVH